MSKTKQKELVSTVRALMKWLEKEKELNLLLINKERTKNMEENRIKPKIIEIVDNQIKINNPTCTKETLERLVNTGLSEKRVKGINR